MKNNFNKNHNIYIYILLTSTSIAFPAADKFNLADHALPNNSIRTKLNDVFAHHPNPQALHAANTWTNFNSFHWLIGQLTTLGGNNNFVVKAQKCEPYTTIVSPDNAVVQIIHTSQQNISRLKVAAKVQDLIQEHNLQHIRVPQSWVYPISGNNADLQNPNITDKEVVIIEELVNKGANTDEEFIQGIGMVQSAALRITPEQFAELKILAEKGCILDLHPKNFFVDNNGKLVLIDLEDLIGFMRENLEKSSWIAKPLKRYKLKCFEEGSALLMVAQTAITNKNHMELNQEGQVLLAKSVFGKLIFQRFAFEIGAVTTAIATAIGLRIRHNRYIKKVDQSIEECRTTIKSNIKKQIDSSKPLQEAQYYDIAKQTIQKALPTETREEITTAFATLSIAEKLKKQNNQQEVSILGTTYTSPEQAIETSLETIRNTWRSDWSVRSKIARGFKAVGSKIMNLIAPTQTEAATITIAA